MKLTTVVLSVNENQKYYRFIPCQLRFWGRLGVRVRVIFVGDTLPAELEPYTAHITLWNHTPNLNSVYVSQHIRMYYPALLTLPADEMVMISDMDTLPLSSTFFLKGLEPYRQHDFLHWGCIPRVAHKDRQVYMMFNAAHPKTWSAVSGVQTIADIVQKLAVNVNSKFCGRPDTPGWCDDQQILFDMLFNYPHLVELNKCCTYMARGALREDFTFHGRTAVVYDNHLPEYRNARRQYDYAEFHRDYESNADAIADLENIVERHTTSRALTSATTLLVTAFYKFNTQHIKHRHNEYRSWLGNILQTIETPIMMFCELDMYAEICRLRGDLPFIPVLLPISSWECSQSQYDTYWKHDHARDTEKDVHSIEVYKVWNEKPFFVHRAIQKTSHMNEHMKYVWIDAGCVRVSDVSSLQTLRKWPHSPAYDDLPKDKVVLLQIADFRAEDHAIQSSSLLTPNIGHPFTYDSLRIGATIIIGRSIKAWARYINAWRGLLNSYMQADYFAGKDQNIMATLCLMYPELVHLILTDRFQPVNAMWFHFVHMFSQPSTANHELQCAANKNASDNARQVCTLHTTGRLGNILFQVAAAHVHCLANNYDLRIVDSQHTTDEYKGTYLRNVSKCITHDLVPNDAGVTSMSYRPIEPGNKQLFGYYQSHKHFENHGDAIRLLFSPSQEFVNAARFRYRGLLDADDFPHYYAVHIRRGDYAHEPDLSILTEEWYFEAMKRAVSLDERSKFMIFSDDIDWCKRCISLRQLRSRIIMFEESDANSTLWFMSSFHNYIISNSTFSWWSVYLNQTAKTVIAPLEWFSATCRLETPDLFIDSWIRLPVPTVRSPRVADTIRPSDIITGERIQRLCDVSIGLERYYDLNDNIHMYCSTQNIINEPGRYTQDRPLVLRSKNVFVYAECLESMLSERSIVFDSCHVYSHNSARTWAAVSHGADSRQFADLQLLSDPIHVGTTFHMKNLCLPRAGCKGTSPVSVQLLPIGIANTMYEHGDVDTLYEIMLLSSETSKTEAVYFEFSVNTNAIERSKCYDYVTRNTNLVFRKRASDYRSFLQTLSQHKYCICPEGYGADCHRTWECFYLGVTPIMRRTPFSETLAAVISRDNHSIVLVDSWEDVNDEYITQLLSTYQPFIVNYAGLKLDHYLERSNANETSLCMGTNQDSTKCCGSVVHAAYRSKWLSCDVTHIIKGHQSSSSKRIHVVNNTMGTDPHPGWYKWLKMKCAGEQHMSLIYCSENKHTYLPRII